MVIKTDNDFFLGHSKRTGITTLGPVSFRSKHEAFRFAAYLLIVAELLPDEPGQEGLTFEQVQEAIQNS